MSIHLKEVQLNDAPMLYRWRFLDEKAVAASFPQSTPNGTHHVGWLCEMLASGAQMFIGYNFSIPVGAVYFLPDTCGFKVSLMIAKEHREKGYGNQLLRSGLALIPPQYDCFAIIKESNEASKKIFRRNNFLPYEKGTSEWTRYQRPADV